MKYVGSKAKHAKSIIPLILRDKDRYKLYVEPFVGGCNVIDKVPMPIRIGNDLHTYLIAFWKAIQSGWVPPNDVSEREYGYIRDHKIEFPPALVAFVGFCCSYSGKWFGGYARGNSNSGKPRNYADEAHRHIMRQAPLVKDIQFWNKDYRAITLPDPAIIYCDPPYENTTGYGGVDAIDYDEFWAWCRSKSREGHAVYVSSYEAPKDFKCLWGKQVNNTLDKNTGAKQGVERLFSLR